MGREAGGRVSREGGGCRREYGRECLWGERESECGESE